MASKVLTAAIAYLRTSSDTNVGADKDSDKRQRAAIARFAKASGYQITDEFYDDDVKGDVEVLSRPGFSALMDRIESNGVRTVIVEDAGRFARKLTVQEMAIEALTRDGVTVFTASGENLTDSDDPHRVAMRQMKGVFYQLDKAILIRRLKAARDRKSKELGRKIDVRKTVDVVYPEATQRAKYLRRYKKMSLREIASTLASEGHTTRGKGTPFIPKIVKSMIEA